MRRERQTQPIAVGVILHRHHGILASVSNALEATIARSTGLPSAGANDIELTVTRIESTAHGTREKLARQRHQRALGNPVHDLTQDKELSTAAKGKVQHLAVQRTPAFAC